MTTKARSLTLGELAAAINGEVVGDPELRVSSVSGVEDATPSALVRVEHPRFLEAALAGPAAAVLTTPDVGPLSKPSIRVPQVRLAFAACLELLSLPEPQPVGIHPTAVIDETAVVDPSCRIGAYAVIGARARLAAGVVVHAHAVIGEDAELGAECEIFPQAVLYPRTVLGARVRVHSGSVIGADGYGYEWDGARHRKIPQVGRVRLCDDVEVGANTAIDRATTGETVIGPGTKIDNLVQIGHNVTTGAHCLIVSQVGMAGSGKLGNGVVIAGQAGLKDHVTVGDGAQIAGKTGVWGDVPPKAVLSGNPGRPHREEIRIQAALGRLPELLRRVADLERRLAERESGGEAAE